MAADEGAQQQAVEPHARVGWFLSPWGPLALVVVTALSIVAWGLTKSGVNREATYLLRNDAGQIQLLLQSTLTSLQSQLRGTAYFTSTAGDSQTVLAQQATALGAGPSVSVAIVELGSEPGQATRVAAAVGPDLHVGQELPAGVLAIVHLGSSSLSGGLVHSGSKTFFALAASSSVRPHSVALEMTPFQPGHAIPNRTGPYAKVWVNIYAGPRIAPDQLLVSTYGLRPLPKPIATSSVKVGNLTWAVAVSPRESLVGAASDIAPWILLGVGVIVAIVLAVLVELLARRQHYARRLVEERTAELIETQRSLLRQERLAAVGEMASVVSHELRNPLSAVINDLYLMRQRLGAAMTPEAERHVVNAEREIYRAATLSEDLLAYTRERTPQWAPVEFSELAAEVLGSTPPPDGIDVTVGSSVSFEADPALMSQVLTNLVTNAYQAMPSGGPVRMGAERVNGDTVISVEDGGRGFDPEMAGRLFDPFFTTKEGGTGLGLAIVLRLVEAHGGTVSIDNVDSGGARVQVRIADGRRSP